MSLFWGSKTVQAAIMLFCYITTYTSRTHISAGHAYLIQHGLLTAKHFGVMSAVSYASVLVVKIASGFLLDYYERPKYSFVISTLFCGILTFVNTVWFTPAAFIVLYTLIKCGVTFHRISVLKALRQHYDGKRFGFITSLLQSISCVGEVLSRSMLGIWLFHLSWQHTWIICGSITLFGSFIYLCTVASDVKPKNVQTKNKHHGFTKHYVKPVVCKSYFWILVAASLISTISREVMMTLTPQLFTVVFGMSGEKAAIMQSFNALPGIICLLIGGAFVDRYYRGNGVPLVCVSLFFALWSMAILYFCSKYGYMTLTGFYTFYLIFQGLMSCPVAFLDGLLVVQFFPKASISMGASWISAAGYIGAIISSLVGRHYTSTKEGWDQLMLASLISIVIQFSCMLFLYFNYNDKNEVENDLEVDVEEYKSTNMVSLT